MDWNPNGVGITTITITFQASRCKPSPPYVHVNKHKNRAWYGSKNLPPCFHPPIETSPSSVQRSRLAVSRLIFHRNETVSTIVRKAFLLSAILRPFSSSLIARRVGERASSRRCTRAASNWKLARARLVSKDFL